MNTQTPSPAEQVGAGLREVREGLGWRLPEIAHGLRIRPEFLAAIEGGDLSSLPGPAYRIGFVRSYSQALGLDGEEILRRFRDGGQLEESAKTIMNLRAPVPDRGVPKGAVILIGLVVVLVGYGLWYHHTERLRRIAQSVPQVPAKLQPLATPPKMATRPASASTMTSAATTSSATPTSATNTTPAAMPPSATSTSATNTITAAAAAPSATPAPSTTPAATAPSATTAAATALSATPASSTTPAATAPSATSATATAPVPGAGMTISATQESWIQVTDANGNILFSKVLNPGESWPVPQESGLRMTTGNAGGTVITTDGKPGQPLGAPGVVLRGYQLTPPASGAPLVSTPTPAGTSPASSAAQ